MKPESNRTVDSTFAAMRDLLEWATTSGQSVSVAVNTEAGLAMGWYMNGHNSLTLHAFRLRPDVTLEHAVNVLMAALDGVASGREASKVPVGVGEMV